jgi:hypothetical protein
MAILNKKISEAEYIGKDISGLPNQPNNTMTATELKAQFDMIMKDVMVPKFNALIDQVASYTTNMSGARFIGFDATEDVFYQSVYDAIIGVAASRVKGTVKLTVALTAPSNPAVGDIWIDTN